MIRSIVRGTGHYLPDIIVENSDFLTHDFFENEGKKSKKNNEEIIRKLQEITEIKRRRYVKSSMLNSDIGTFAAQNALSDAKIDKENIDYIITAHNYGDIHSGSHQSDMMPSISARIKHKLNIRNSRCRPYDMIFGCPGWVEGLILADQLLRSRHARNILVIGSEILSRVVDPYDRNAMIFSDGAGAALLSAEKSDQNIGILHYDSQCDNNEELYYLTNGPSVNPDYKDSKINIRMNGRRIYEYALTAVPKLLKKTIDDADLSIKDIQKILIHQANAKMDHAILKRLLELYGQNTDDDNQLMPMTIQELGNSSVATVPTLLDRLLKGQLPGHCIQTGDSILLASLGAGMNSNALIYRFP
ncbi:3-oxoacyl-ACP synthase III family protein [Bacteroidetes bacterium endosymbiont of Geopemphigus sp.]|uniref:3-oxoacyl-ACP synthase III family protein n=1 Tax=Bacteroidetes bacterium endosymbiont of Geopemphigus sp. TaxID=2047937 RepID=UPI000CD30C8D|nr:3-oxoacyl-ACP synthase III family protein [Bacteroidetes bacterium endosymbiont of Geopemphigus sp.]